MKKEAEEKAKKEAELIRTEYREKAEKIRMITKESIEKVSLEILNEIVG